MDNKQTKADEKDTKQQESHPPIIPVVKHSLNFGAQNAKPKPSENSRKGDS